MRARLTGPCHKARVEHCPAMPKPHIPRTTCKGKLKPSLVSSCNKMRLQGCSAADADQHSRFLVVGVGLAENELAVLMTCKEKSNGSSKHPELACAASLCNFD